MINVVYISNADGGYAKNIDLAESTTVDGFFKAFVGGDPTNFKIRVDSRPAEMDQVLEDGNRITISPTKITGGSR